MDAKVFMKQNLNLKVRISLLSLLMLLFVTGCASGTSTGDTGYVAGTRGVTWVEKGKRIEAPVLAGKTLNGADLVTKSNSITVLNVWASWCSPCRAEAPLLQDFANKYSNVNFVGVLTRDNLSAAKSFVENFKISYPTLIEDDILLKFKESLPANAIPTTLIIDKENKVAVRFSGAITTVSFERYLNQILSEA